MSQIISFTPPHPLNTAVLLLIFNRLDTTKQVFQAIRQAKPPRLYVASDGARVSKKDEVEKVQTVRNYIMQNIDWECEVKTLFRDQNLGCKFAVSGAINWFFENEEQGIILEDDCLPSQSFFWFCEELLERYRYDQRIFLISGYNKQGKWVKENQSYIFSSLGGIWGWASWRSAWKAYDCEMKDLNEFIEIDGFENQLGSTLGKIRKKQMLNAKRLNATGKMSSWDFPWGYARHKQSGLACVPVNSLIENIGFGDEATHTFGVNRDFVKSYELSFPLKVNEFIVPDRAYDEKFFLKDNFIKRIFRKLLMIIGLKA